MLSIYIVSFLLCSSWAWQNFTVDDRDPRISYTGNWSRAYDDAAILKSFTISQGPNDIALFVFNGTAVYYMAPLWPYRTYTYLSIDSSPLTLVNLTDPTHSESTRGSATFASAIVWSATKLDNSQHTLLVSIAGMRSSAVIDAILYTAPSRQDIRFIAIGSSIGGFVLLSLLICLCMVMRRYKCIRRSKDGDYPESAQSASVSPAKMESPPVSRVISLHRHDPSPASPAAEIITTTTSRHARRISQPELSRASGVPSVVPSFPPMGQAHGLRFPPAARTVCHSAPPSPTVPMYPMRKESHLRQDSNANLAGMGSGSGYFHSRRESLSGVSILDSTASASARTTYAVPRTTPGNVVRHYSYSNLLPASTSAAVAQGDIGLTGQMDASSRPTSWIDFVLPLKQGSQAQMQFPSSMSRSTAGAGKRRDVGVHVTPQDLLDKLDANREVSQPEELPSQTAVKVPPSIPCGPSFVEDTERELAGPFAVECFPSEVVEVSPVEATKWTPHADVSESRALVATPALIPPERDLTPPPPPPQTIANYNPILGLPRPGKIELLLRDYDFVLLIDDSGSMSGVYWNEAREAVNELANWILDNGWDRQGVALRFLNSNCQFHFKDLNGITDKGKIREVVNAVSPSNGTPTGRRTHEILNTHIDALEKAKGTPSYAQIRPLILVVITDGEPYDSSPYEISCVLIEAAKRLSECRHHPNSIAVQFVQVGMDPMAALALKLLTELPTNGMVDAISSSELGTLSPDKLGQLMLGGMHPNIRSRAAFSLH